MAVFIDADVRVIAESGQQDVARFYYLLKTPTDFEAAEPHLSVYTEADYYVLQIFVSGQDYDGTEQFKGYFCQVQHNYSSKRVELAHELVLSKLTEFLEKKQGKPVSEYTLFINATNTVLQELQFAQCVFLRDDCYTQFFALTLQCLCQHTHIGVQKVAYAEPLTDTLLKISYFQMLPCAWADREEIRPPVYLRGAEITQYAFAGATSGVDFVLISDIITQMMPTLKPTEQRAVLVDEGYQFKSKTTIHEHAVLAMKHGQNAYMAEMLEQLGNEAKRAQPADLEQKFNAFIAKQDYNDVINQYRSQMTKARQESIQKLTNPGNGFQTNGFYANRMCLYTFGTGHTVCTNASASDAATFILKQTAEYYENEENDGESDESGSDEE